MLSVSLLTLGSPEQLTGGYLYHRRIADLAPAYDANVRFVSFRPAPFPLPAYQAGEVMRQVTQQAAQQDGQVVLVDSIVAAFVAPWLAVHRPAWPLAAILHQPPGGIDAGPARRAVQARFDVATYRQAAVLVLASEPLATMLPRRLTSGRQVVVVPPGRDVAPEAAHVGDLRAGRRAAFLCVGNWVERKGILDLLEAFAPLPAGAATLHLVGREDAEPTYGAGVRARLRQPDLAGRVVVHGPVDQRTVAGLYRAADAFVLASMREPYGTVYGEAMATGLPVVGWRAGNLPHLAGHEREGLIVEPGDLAGLTAALQRLAYDEELRRRLGAAAQRRAESFPTWEQSAQRLFSVLGAMVQPPR